MPTTFDFGKNLFSLRKKLNLSRKEVAEQLGITTRSYGLYETNKSTPPIERLPKLAEILHCSIDELFGYDGVSDFESSINQLETIHLHTYRLSNGEIAIGDKKSALLVLKDEQHFVEEVNFLKREFFTSRLFRETFQHFCMATMAIQTRYFYKENEKATPLRKQPSFDEMKSQLTEMLTRMEPFSKDFDALN